MQFQTFQKKYVTHSDLNQLLSITLKFIKQQKPNLYNLAHSKTVNLNFITDLEITELNKSYRQKNKPTDVLSWGFLTENLMPHEIAGEIYISIDTAKLQAKTKKLPIKDEILFLITHGLLHIFEYDHLTDDQESEMNKLTIKILAKQGINICLPI